MDLRNLIDAIVAGDDSTRSRGRAILARQAHAGRIMNPSTWELAKGLIADVADLPPAERERVLAERAVPTYGCAVNCSTCSRRRCRSHSFS